MMTGCGVIKSFKNNLGSRQTNPEPGSAKASKNVLGKGCSAHSLILVPIYFTGAQKAL
jgi:hypothetical protein